MRLLLAAILLFSATLSLTSSALADRDSRYGDRHKDDRYYHTHEHAHRHRYPYEKRYRYSVADPRYNYLTGERHLKRRPRRYPDKAYARTRHNVAVGTTSHSALRSSRHTSTWDRYATRPGRHAGLK